MTVGERIRQNRLNKKMTQKELGEKAGIAEPTIRRYELGKLNPKFETLQKIADALDVGIDKLKGIKPLPEKEVELDLGFKKEKASMSSGAIELEAFDKFLEDIGFKTYVSPTLFENPEGKNGDVWIIEDIRENKFYAAKTTDLNKLKDSILSFSKFQIYELLNSLKQIDSPKASKKP
ncbi:MAG TPA: helix-turn-helix transcriptional regulator [Candidatus Gallacutalibacter stercoravium]|nr:helix-turn-helix transcriptional regulator [Candidatus Gallacutalibacter stercoravium]